mgnify:CR=1 FL=1
MSRAREGVGRLLTIEEVAERLTVTPSAIRRWRVEGYGPPSIKVGSRVRFSSTAVEAWLVDQERYGA